ncbi:MAG: CotH kinase family protein [Deltaproteobacteria bacterium]|nr:CotH kinase family protein [Deltaproteobacteria bacterium]
MSYFDADDTDWKPSPKDIAGQDTTAPADAVLADTAPDAVADTAPDTAADDTAVGSDADTSQDGTAAPFSPDIGGGLPSEITKIGTPTSLFDVTGIHTVKLSVDPTEWAAYMDGVDKPDGKKVYEWHPAAVEVDGVAYGEAGIHGFGNGSQIDNPQKPNVRIKFDHYTDTNIGPEGEKAFRLKASGQDDTFLRELLAGALLREAGGNAPRMGWARLWVNGKDFGPYQLQEAVDKRYFKYAFGNNDGDKFVQEYGCLGFDCPAKGCDGLAKAWSGDPGDTQVIVDLAKAVTAAADADLKQVLGDYFYLGELLADYAVDALLSNIDGLASAGQNFTAYADEKTKRLHIIATGTDLTFGGFGAWYDLQTPWGSPNAWCPTRADQIYTRIWQVPDLKSKLLTKLRNLQCGMFHQDKLLPLIASYKAVLKPMLTSDPVAKQSPGQVEAAYGSLTSYIKKRQQTLVDLLGACPQ